MNTDGELLRRYAERGDEGAFAEVVARQVDLVYSASLRLMGGDAHLAQDVTQAVFVGLARKAGGLARRGSIAGWLYTTARFIAAKTRRGERRRWAREQEAMIMNEGDDGRARDWESVRLALEEAVGALGGADREAVLLRFFQNKSHREVGAALGWSEDTARKRVERAVEKLRVYFGRRGVTMSGALLAEVIGVNSVQAAPAGMAASVSAGALAGVGGGAAGVIGKIFAMTTKTKIIMGAAVVVLVAGFTVQEQRIAQLHRELAAARSDAAARNAPAADGTGGGAKTLTEILNQDGSDAIAGTRDALKWVETVKPADIRGALETMNKRMARDGDSSEVIRNLLLTKWVESDPQGALAWVKKEGGDHGGADLTMMFEAWGLKDPEAALAGLKQINNAANKVNAAGWMLGEIAKTNPQEALHLLQELPPTEQDAGVEYRMFASWTGVDPTGAAAAAANLPPSLARSAALEGTANAWVMLDPAAALAWGQTLTDIYARSDAIENGLAAYAGQHPEEAARMVEAMPPGDARNSAMSGVSYGWASTDPQAALAWLGKMATGQMYDEAATGILSNLGEKDPAMAAALIAQLPDATTRSAAIKQLASTWAQNDFTDAVAWAQSLPASDGAARGQALRNVMKNWEDTDPADAATYLAQNFADDPNLSTLTDELAKRWAMGDPPAAVSWAEGLPAGPAQDSAMTTALGFLAKTDPQAAWSATAQMTDEAGQAKARAAVVESWGANNPAQAAAVYNQIPEGEQQVEAATTLAKAWVAQDPKGASQWMATLPAGAARDAAVTQLITAEGANDPATAFNWAKSISNPDGELTQLNNVVNAWAKVDAAAAAGAVQAAGLTEAQKAALLKTVEAAGAGTAK